ncbi:MAG TPA: trigger factor [Dehalococcoidia bacterium]|nr:trigger factor [Dehalococcoidia bacterium]
MKITSNKTEQRTSYITIEMEPAEVDEYIENAYKRMVKNVDIPGFRKGNAPREVLEKHVGKDKLIEEARKELLPKTCSQAIREHGLKPLTQPMVKIIQEEPLVFEMVLPLVPIVELGDYRSISMQPEKVEIADKDIDGVIEQIRQQYATYNSVDRSVKSGDIVTIDILGTVLESPIINSKGVHLKVSSEYSTDIPGLTDQFVGMKKGEEKEFKLKLPENYPNKLVAEKEATFKTKIIEIKEEKLPELDEGLVKMVAPDLKTPDELRERIAKNMKIDYERQANIKFEEDLVAALIDMSKLEVSPLMLETEANILMQQSIQQLQSECRTKEAYEEKIKQLSMEKLKEQCQKIAENRIYWSLVLSEVAKAENIWVNDKEIAEEIDIMLQSVPDQEKENQRQQLSHPQNIENVRNVASARKTIYRLKEIAASSDKPKKPGKRTKRKNMEKR